MTNNKAISIATVITGVLWVFNIFVGSKVISVAVGFGICVIAIWSLINLKQDE